MVEYKTLSIFKKIGYQDLQVYVSYDRYESLGQVLNKYAAEGWMVHSLTDSVVLLERITEVKPVEVTPAVRRMKL